ncbi:MAG: hypothetical protein ACM3NQ_02590 [Bacteroidales bacterium]
MNGEIIVFWKLPDGTRCSVVRRERTKWRLVIERNGTELLAEDYLDASALLRRANELRPVYARSVA